MAHALFDVYQGGVPILDTNAPSQLAVQTLLESRTTGSPLVDNSNRGTSNSILDVILDNDGDIFQCGKCKKQFPASAYFEHKKQPCVMGGTSHSSSLATGTLGLQSTNNVGVPRPARTGSIPVPTTFPQVDLNETDLLTLAALDGQTLTIPVSGGGAPSVAPYIPQMVATTGSSLTQVAFSSSTAIAPPNLSPQMITSIAGTQPVMVPIQTNSEGQQASLNTGSTAILSLTPMKSMPLLTKALVANGIEADDDSDLKPLLPHNLSIDIAAIKIEDENILCEQSEDGTLTYSIVTELQAPNDNASDSAPAAVVNGEPKIDGGVVTIEMASVSRRQELPLARSKKRRKATTVRVDALGKKVNKLKCMYCEKGFAKNFDLQQHIRSHTGEKPFQCIVCGRAFAQKSNVKKHMLTHKVWPDGLSHTLPRQSSITTSSKANSNQPVKDPHEKSLADRTIMENQAIADSGTIDSSPKEGKDSNSPSDPVTNTTSMVDEHLDVDHSYACQYCGELFKTYCQLKTHRKTHKNQQVFKCIMKSCGQTFQELDLFLEHTKSHENEMNYRCHVCSNLFGSLYDLGIHQYSHNVHDECVPKVGVRQYRCKKCLCKYSTPAALDHHMATSSHHYGCPHCEKVFPCERYLRRHLTIHNSAVLHTCTVCCKSFKTEHYLRTHMLIHSGDKPFECCQCQARFNRKDKLKRHLLIHEPVKRFKCPFRAHTGCTKEFHRPDKLKAHIITHSGIRPYQCRTCGRGFSRRAHLREHQQTHNDENSKFACSTCGKGFTDETKLKEHACSSEPTSSAKRRRPGRSKGRRKVIKRLVSVKCDSSEQPKLRKVGRPRKKPLPPIQLADDNGTSVEAASHQIINDFRNVEKPESMEAPSSGHLTEMRAMVEEFPISEIDGQDNAFNSLNATSADTSCDTVPYEMVYDAFGHSHGTSDNQITTMTRCAGPVMNSLTSADDRQRQQTEM